ncbi:hypothetical protein ABZU32_17735 [Sphaerisporangium sp. NPDC005288]
MGKNLDFFTAESLDKDSQELTDAERERLEELLGGATTRASRAADRTG